MIIYVIGGRSNKYAGFNTNVDYVHRIHTIYQWVKLETHMHLNVPVCSTAPIIVNGWIYTFGGTTNPMQYDDTLQYYILSTTSPIESPTREPSLRRRFLSMWLNRRTQIQLLEQSVIITISIAYYA